MSDISAALGRSLKNGSIEFIFLQALQRCLRDLIHRGVCKYKVDYARASFCSQEPVTSNNLRSCGEQFTQRPQADDQNPPKAPSRTQDSTESGQSSQLVGIDSIPCRPNNDFRPSMRPLHGTAYRPPPFKASSVPPQPYFPTPALLSTP